MGDYSEFMDEIPPEGVTPFVFSDPSGKRWPRLRLILLIASVLFFLGTVLFVQTLFVAPKMNVPFSLRQLKGQLKALIVSGFAAVAEIWRGATSGKKARRLSPHASAAAAEEIARQ